ncbi:MAG: hypothetical protein U9N36_10170 [Euryarchaeota archaeon]|nr:hypothetical protein [Euryarchaeota archaeon]
MDTTTVIEDGPVTYSEDLEWSVKLYQDWQRDGYAGTIVQANVEDTGLGVQEYALKKLSIDTVELRWGQGAKDIGGEVKIKDLARAQMLGIQRICGIPGSNGP